MVVDFSRLKMMSDSYGAVMLTGPWEEWPGKLVELLELLEQERIAEHNSRIRAELAEMERK